MPFTHVAAHHARLVVTNAMLRTRRSVNYGAIPWVTFTDPEIARVGLDADTARRRWGERSVIRHYDYADLDRAVTHGVNRGWVELVGDPRRRLVGDTVVGETAGESIAELTAWITGGAKIDAVSTTVHAYPTFAERPSRAADDVLRARQFNPRLTRVTSKVLGALRCSPAGSGSGPPRQGRGPSTSTRPDPSAPSTSSTTRSRRPGPVRSVPRREQAGADGPGPVGQIAALLEQRRGLRGHVPVP
ncbi:MAG: hypothetical protein ACK5RL_19080 [Acidimicrobiales bacterium]